MANLIKEIEEMELEYKQPNSVVDMGNLYYLVGKCKKELEELQAEVTKLETENTKYENTVNTAIRELKSAVKLMDFFNSVKKVKENILFIITLLEKTKGE